MFTSGLYYEYLGERREGKRYERKSGVVMPPAVLLRDAFAALAAQELPYPPVPRQGFSGDPPKTSSAPGTGHPECVEHCLDNRADTGHYLALCLMSLNKRAVMDRDDGEAAAAARDALRDVIFAPNYKREWGTHVKRTQKDAGKWMEWGTRQENPYWDTNPGLTGEAKGGWDEHMHLCMEDNGEWKTVSTDDPDPDFGDEWRGA